MIAVSFTPNGSLPGSDTIAKLVGGLAEWGLYACLAAIVIGGAWWGWSQRSSNYHGVHSGRNLLLGGVIGAIVIGAANVIVAWAFTTGSGVH